MAVIALIYLIVQLHVSIHKTRASAALPPTNTCLHIGLCGCRKVQRQETAAAFGFACASGEEAKRRRASVLCAWLVNTFGAGQLRAGSGVLDVAGAAGPGVGQQLVYLAIVMSSRMYLGRYAG